MSELNNYKIIRGLGEGAFGKVKLAQHVFTEKFVAIKFMDIEKAKQQNLYSCIEREIRILRKIDHPNIVKLYDLVQTEKYVHLILEYVSGGELYNFLEREGKFDENKAKILFWKIAEAVNYTHSKKVAHRDLKLENILMDANFNPKISDFGLSNYMKDGQFLNTCCGSANYAAPELLSNTKYCGSEIDVWSLGVILYALVSGNLPFDEPTLPLLYDKIKRGRYRIPYHCSAPLLDLISKCFIIDPINRISVSEILSHSWFDDLYLRSYTRTKDLKAIGIDDIIFEKLIEDKNFLAFKNDKNKLREKILKKKGFDLFTTSYQLLADCKKYGQSGVKEMGKVFGDCYFPFRQLIQPNDWVNSLKVEMSSEELVEILFTNLKNAGLEWKIVEKFKIRVRSIDMRRRTKLLENSNRAKVKKEVKFEVVVFRDEQILTLDFRIIFGNTFAFFDLFETIRRKLQ